jgi:predicted DNA-binding transcriptional regulator YafY
MKEFQRHKTLRRMFALIEALSQGRLCELTELADKFQVSTRTIWRDVGILRDCGFQIEHDLLEYEGTRHAAFQLLNQKAAHRIAELRRTA